MTGTAPAIQLSLKQRFPVFFGIFDSKIQRAFPDYFPLHFLGWNSGEEIDAIL